jgi:hypothetical protein
MKSKMRDKIGYGVVKVCVFIGAAWVVYNLLFTVLPGAYYFFFTLPELIERYERFNDTCQRVEGDGSYTYYPCDMGWWNFGGEINMEDR